MRPPIRQGSLGFLFLARWSEVLLLPADDKTNRDSGLCATDGVSWFQLLGLLRSRLLRKNVEDFLGVFLSERKLVASAMGSGIWFFGTYLKIA